MLANRRAEDCLPTLAKRLGNQGYAVVHGWLNVAQRAFQKTCLSSVTGRRELADACEFVIGCRRL